MSLGYAVLHHPKLGYYITEVRADGSVDPTIRLLGAYAIICGEHGYFKTEAEAQETRIKIMARESLL